MRQAEADPELTLSAVPVTAVVHVNPGELALKYGIGSNLMYWFDDSLI